MKLQLLLVFLFFLNCALFAQQPKNNKNGLTYKTDSIISTNGMKIKFRYSENKDGLIKLVNIHFYSKDKRTQTINLNEYVEKYNAAQLIDYNFDGINDLSVNTECGASGNCTYLVWLYNTKNKKYEFAKELSNRTGLDIDKKNKYILFNYWGGAGNEFSDTLRYVKGKLKSLFKH